MLYPKSHEKITVSSFNNTVDVCSGISNEKLAVDVFLKYFPCSEVGIVHEAVARMFHVKKYWINIFVILIKVKKQIFNRIIKKSLSYRKTRLV